MDENQRQKFDAVVDGIADSGIAVVDDFLSRAEVADIVGTDEFAEGLLRFKKAGIGKSQEKQINESIRGDFIEWINKETTSTPIKKYLAKLLSLQQHLNQSLFLSLKDFEVHLTTYPVGTFYKRHLDQFKKDDHRKLSVIFYLNENWQQDDGGQLRVYHPTRHEDYFPIAGRLVCFRSDLLEHEVLPATRERMSITGWFLDREIDLKHL